MIFGAVPLSQNITIVMEYYLMAIPAAVQAISTSVYDTKINTEDNGAAVMASNKILGNQ